MYNAEFFFLFHISCIFLCRISVDPITWEVKITNCIYKTKDKRHLQRGSENTVVSNQAWTPCQVILLCFVAHEIVIGISSTLSKKLHLKKRLKDNRFPTHHIITVIWLDLFVTIDVYGILINFSSPETHIAEIHCQSVQLWIHTTVNRNQSDPPTNLSSCWQKPPVVH